MCQAEVEHDAARRSTDCGSPYRKLETQISRLGTIAYEVVCGLGDRVERRYEAP